MRGSSWEEDYSMEENRAESMKYRLKWTTVCDIGRAKCEFMWTKQVQFYGVRVSLTASMLRAACAGSLGGCRHWRAGKVLWATLTKPGWAKQPLHLSATPSLWPWFLANLLLSTTSPLKLQYMLSIPNRRSLPSTVIRIPQDIACDCIVIADPLNCARDPTAPDSFISHLRTIEGMR